VLNNIHLKTEPIFDQILINLRQYIPKKKKKKIKMAYNYTLQAFDKLKRPSGEPFMKHILASVLVLSNLKVDEATICTCFLHELPKNTNISISDIKSIFGAEISFLITRVGFLTNATFKINMSENQLATVIKMILVIAQDLRVFLVKIADRLDLLKRLENFNSSKKERLLLESLEIYCPILNLLGIWQLLSKMEDLCFSALYPHDYAKIEKRFSKDKKARTTYINIIKNTLKKELVKHNIKSAIEGRMKHFYSIFKKIQKKQKNFNEIYDVFAFRIITKTINECYSVLGVIHQIWAPKVGRFKDYIASPKTNGYQSLHTTIHGPDGKLTEFQIRTDKMNNQAEFGIAAHWYYKNKENTNIRDSLWINELLNLQKTSKNEEEIIKKMSVDVFNDRIFVFTPKRDIIDLPKGSTVLDFAYAINVKLGHIAHSALINNKKNKLNKILETGDVIKINTHKKSIPNIASLAFLVTSQAKHEIKNWHKKNN